MPKTGPLKAIFNPTPRRGQPSFGATIGEVTGLEFSYLWDFADTASLTMSGARVHTITDQIAGVVANEYTLGPNALSTINGVQAINQAVASDNRAGFNANLPSTVPRPFTVVTVCQPDTITSTFGALAWRTCTPGPNDEIQLRMSGSTLVFQHGVGPGGLSLNYPGVAINDVLVVMVVVAATGGTDELWVNGVLVDSGVAPATAMLSTLFSLFGFGATVDQPGGNCWSGKGGLIGISSGTPTTGERTAWFVDVMATYGI